MNFVRRVVAGVSGESAVESDYLGDLNTQSDRLLWFALVVGLVVFLPYVPVDRALHPEHSWIVLLRYGFSAISLALLLLRLFASFPYRGLILGTIYIAYLTVSVAVITGLAAADPVYMGGYRFVLMLLPLAPLPRRILFPVLAVSMLTFALTLALHSLPEAGLRTDYSRNDFLVAVVVAAGLIYLLGAWRFRSWERSRRILHESKRADDMLVETTQLAGLVKRINEQHSPTGVIEHVFAFLSGRFRLTEVVLLAVDQKTQELVPSVHLYTQAPQGAREYVTLIRIPLDETGGLLARVLRRKRPFLMRDVDRGDIFRRDYPGMQLDREIITRLHLKSFLTMPLVMQDEGIGMLLLTNYQERLNLNAAELEYLRRIGDQIAPAVHTALLLEQLRAEREKVRDARAEIEYLNQITRRIAEAPTFSNALEIVRKHLRERFGIRQIALFRHNAIKRQLELFRESIDPRLAAGAREELLELPIATDPEKSIHGRVCAAGRAAYFRHLRSGPRISLAESRLLGHLEMRSALIVPLIRDNELIGVLSCTNGPEAMKLSAEDVDAVAVFCNHVSGILHTFALLGDARAAKERSEGLRADLLSLHAFARDLNAHTRYQEIVDAIYAYAAVTFPAEIVWLLRVDEEAGLFRHEERSVQAQAATGPNGKGLPKEIPVGREAGAIFQVYRRRRIVHITNVDRVRGLMSDIDRDLSSKATARDVLYCPLILQNKVVGMLGFSGLKAGALRDSARIHLKAFCEQAAGAMQRTMLAERGEQNRKRMAKIGQMAAGIIHDIKNPMTTIKGYAEMSDTDVGPVRRKEYLDRIGQEVDRLSRMSYDILEFAGGRYQLDLDKCELESLVREVLFFKEEECVRHGIEIDVKFEVGLAARLDRERMRRALLNLTGNAIEALQSVDASRRALSFAGRASGDCVELCVRDTGPGIDERVRPHLFEAFATAGKVGGTGLGLSIVASIIEGHGGTISCDSTPGAGTEFRIRLPGCLPSEAGVADSHMSETERRAARDRRSQTDRRAESASATSPEDSAW